MQSNKRSISILLFFSTKKKPDGSYRFILNLKNLNTFIQAPHFKLEDYRTALKLITPNCFLTSIDLKDAYFLLPIDSHYRKYLRFRFGANLYEFTCLPFGLNIAPYIFTKLMKPVAKALRQKGIISVFYLDDILLINNTQNKCIKNTKITLKLLQTLGFKVNFKKSNLIPQQEIKFLGFLYNTMSMTISLPNEKNSTVKKSLKAFREFAGIIGRLVAACPATRYGFVHTK